MKKFDSVVIACDNEASTLRQATAIRGVLESFSLRVHFRHLVQVSHVIDFFAGDRPPSDYTILCCHGTTTEEDGDHLLLGVIDSAPLDPPVGGWDEEWNSYLIRATPAWFSSPACIIGAEGMAWFSIYPSLRGVS